MSYQNFYLLVVQYLDIYFGRNVPSSAQGQRLVNISCKGSDCTYMRIMLGFVGHVVSDETTHLSVNVAQE